MWVWVVSAIAGSILGNATDSWFSQTKLGIWFYKKMDNLYAWTANKLNIEILASEEKWKKKYPNIAAKMHELEQRLQDLEKEKIND